MYLAPEYAPDVFITYSHGDVDGSGQSELKAWSQRFARALEDELRQDGEFRKLALFLDQSARVETALDPTLPLTKQLREQVERAAILTVLMSPQDLGSTWCGDERAWWLARHGERGDIPGRVFVVRVLPTEDEAWPEAFRDERGHTPVGFWFHPRAAEGPAVRPFGWRGRTDDQNDYTSALLNLVGAMSRRLRGIKQQVQAERKVQEEAQRLAAEGGQTLYLHARDEHRAAWENAYGALDRLGYVVVPTEPERRADTPARLREIASERANQLVACDGLLLLGTDDGVALDGDMLTVGRQSRHLARALSGKLLPCAVLARGAASVRSEQRLALARKLAIDWIDAVPEAPPPVRDWLASATTKLVEI
jgi:hypothetical protein